MHWRSTEFWNITNLSIMPLGDAARLPNLDMFSSRLHRPLLRARRFVTLYFAGTRGKFGSAQPGHWDRYCTY
eukprot:COSAG02_NODE_560_length_20328_cov_15.507343_13_plen_72_part_00